MDLSTPAVIVRIFNLILVVISLYFIMAWILDAPRRWLVGAFGVTLVIHAIVFYLTLLTISGIPNTAINAWSTALRTHCWITFLGYAVYIRIRTRRIYGRPT
jgi:hypothetical protein